jgi:RNA polymerase sigma factor (sigma-70 family)
VKQNGMMDAVGRDLQTLFGVGVMGTVSDGQLLDRFLVEGDEAVFEAIVRRHGQMVWGVCRRVLGDHHDTEDAFQATFLVLARKAASIMPRGHLGNWLHGVACQTAMKARAKRSKRRGREIHVPEMPEPMAKLDGPRAELAELLDRELRRLPARYRTPVILCDFEGRTHKEAAGQLGWPIGTVSSRLSRARSMLARRLSRQGVSLTVSSLAVLMAEESASASMPTGLIGFTVRAASLIAAGGTATATAGVVPAGLVTLMEEVMKMMVLSKIKVAAAMLTVASAVAVGGTGLAYRAQAQGPKQEGRTAAAIASAPGETVKPEELDDVEEAVAEIRWKDADDPRQDKQEEGPLSSAITSGNYTLDELEFAKALMEEMITFEKEIQGKSPEELDEMIRATVWSYRLEVAKLRRLKQMRARTHHGQKNQGAGPSGGTSAGAKSGAGQDASLFLKRRPRTFTKEEPAQVK